MNAPRRASQRIRVSVGSRLGNAKAFGGTLTGDFSFRIQDVPRSYRKAVAIDPDYPGPKQRLEDVDRLSDLKRSSE